MKININRVVITGNLTHDPEVKTTRSGTKVCRLQVAVNGRRRDGDNGWIDKPNFFRVVVFGRPAESCGEYLRKGRAVAVDGSLDWSRWTPDGGEAREMVQIIADSVEFLGAPSSTDDQPNGEDHTDNDPQDPSDIPF